MLNKTHLPHPLSFSSIIQLFASASKQIFIQNYLSNLKAKAEFLKSDGVSNYLPKFA